MRKVNFRSFQQLIADDMSNVGDHRQDHLRQLVSDGLGDAQYYVGLTVTQASNSEVRVASGKFYDSGTIYEKAEAVIGGIQADDIELFQFIPTINERIIAVTVSGLPVDTSSVPRDFLIDVVNEITEPDAVTTVRVNQAVIGTLAGAVSKFPTPPVIPINQLHIANIFMDINGIYKIEMLTDNLLPSTSRNFQNLLQAQRTLDRYAGILDYIKTTISSIEAMATDVATGVVAFEVATEFARIQERVNLPETFEFYGSDHFATPDETDDTYGAYDARIFFGLLFPEQASATFDVSLLNPADPSVTINGDLVLPKYNEEVLYDSGTAAYDGASNIQIAFTSQTFDTSPVEITGYVQAQGQTYNQWYTWWQRQYGYDMDTINPTPPFHLDEPQRHWYFKVLTGKYIKEWTSGWSLKAIQGVSLVSTVTSRTGAIVAQTFIPGRSFWCTGVNLFFTELDNAGDVEAFMCSVDDTGRPAFDEVYASSTVEFASLKTYPTATEFTFDEPFFIDGGKRFCVVLVTSGQHNLASLTDSRLSEGDLLYSADGDFFKLDILRDILFELRGAKFEKTFLNVSMNPASLSGGIESILFSGPALEPLGSDLNYEIRASGAGSWHAVTEPNEVLNYVNRPELVNIRASLSGTSTVMPGFKLAVGKIQVSSDKTAFTHFSVLRSLASASADFTFVVYALNYDPAIHSLDFRLVNPSDAQIAPDTESVRTEFGENGDELMRFKYEFSLGSSISQFRTKLSGTRSNANAAPFQIVEIIYVSGTV